MSGKRMVVIVILIATLGLSACSIQANTPSNIDIGEGPLNNPGPQTHSATPSNTPASNEPTKEPVENAQEIENLPDAEELTSFPGMLESLSLTLEQLVTVLGMQFELIENKAQGYDSYFFPQYNLTFDFDRISKKLSTLWLNNEPYYIYAGDFKVQDLNGDGKAEKIVAYEDQSFMGCLLVIDGADSSKVSVATLDSFGDQCDIEVLLNLGQDKESLILLKTRGGIQGDLFLFSNGNLTSILPEDYDSIAKEALATIEGTKALWVHEKRNMLNMYTLPERIAKGAAKRTDIENYRYDIRVKPMLSGDSLYLEARTSLQLKLSDNYNFIDNIEGIYCDVAQITVEYQYLGHGKWKENKTTSGSKYDNSQVTELVAQDLSVGDITLYDQMESIDKALLDRLSAFTPDELDAGVLLEEEGLRIGITQDKITFLSLEEGSNDTTLKGLKLSDTREKALSLYGIPDKGFIEDDAWTYFVLREEESGSEISSLIDTMNLEFEDDKVSRIWISAYVTAY